ncbi:MAG: 4-hydroxy-tetrahydrodipicolinate reductase [Acidimicrobiales bacterium]|jgi:4-hydroxy-tetrahydrodipicolinate reductase
MIRVGVLGAAGRMGATVCAAVAEAEDLDLVAAADPAGAGRMLGEVVSVAGASLVGPHAAIEVAAEADMFAANGVQVAVDFTVAKSARENLVWCAENGVHVVCGTTGLTDQDLADFERLFGDPLTPNCVLAANFSIGAVLMMRCAEICAPYMDGVEIIELHHDHKRDAPSGTSLQTVRRIEAARQARGAGRKFAGDPTEQVVLEGTRGGVSEGGVRVHSIRLPGLVAHQEVIFGSVGETLTIRHDSIDRASFMSGVLLAVRRVADTPGLTVGLESLLGL